MEGENMLLWDGEDILRGAVVEPSLILILDRPHRLLLKCVLDNNIIPTTRGPTKLAVLATAGSFTKAEARRTPLAPATVYRAPQTGR